MPRALALARFLSRWLDKRYLDPIIGFVLPEVGDLMTTLAGFSVVVLAWREGASAALLARMVSNLAIDGIVGAIPIVGDLFDLAFRANSKNLALLEKRDSRAATGSDYLMLVVSLLGVLVAIALPVIALIAFVRWLF